jgi:murein DD-endopeptidase MepM/ murein hydrolase activator NlpD
LQQIISYTEQELKLLKKQYSKLISETYNSKKRYNEIAFFFGASSFNEAYRRYTMLKEYNRFRHNQGIVIQQKKLDLDKHSTLLSAKLKVKENSLYKLKDETVSLQKDRTRLDNDVQQLAQKESKIKRDIQKKKRALKKLEDTIVKLIAELSKGKVEPSDFKLAKGSLSWPVQNGVIVSRFGVHQHAVLKYVKVNNNGLDIQSTSNNDVKNVFKGVVTRVVPIPGYNRAVIIRHGRFLTVYANLDKVHVINGQNVTKGDLIGTIYSGDGDNSNVLHFEVWEENVKLDPEKWLK